MGTPAIIEPVMSLVYTPERGRSFLEFRRFRHAELRLDQPLAVPDEAVHLRRPPAKADPQLLEAPRPRRQVILFEVASAATVRRGPVHAPHGVDLAVEGGALLRRQRRPRQVE